MVRRFAEGEIRPRAAALDEGREDPAEILRQLGEIKMMGIAVPEEFGGGGMDHVSYALALMEVSRACASTGALMAVNHSLYCFPLTAFGSREQKMKYLYPCAAGDRFGCYALSEEGMEADHSGMQTRAVRHGDEWIINGEKRFVTAGGIASYCILGAVTGKGAEGFSHFVIDMERTPGFKRGRIEETAGLRAVGIAEMIFEDVRVPPDAILGEQGDGFDQMKTLLPGGWTGIAAQAVGVGRAVLDEAIEYVNSGQGSGRALSSSQTVQWKLADMATELDAAELLTLRAAWLWDLGKPCEKEAAMAKMAASDAAMRASIEGLQILGQAGYGRSSSMERHMRDAKICQIYEGAVERMRLVIADGLFQER